MKSPLIKFITALFVLIITFIGYGVWYDAISEKSADVAKLESQITTTIETASRIASARTALDKIIGDETLVQSYFVPETGVVAFINDLEARGRSQGAVVSVDSVSAGGTLARPILAFALTITGTFDTIMRTVGIIEYSSFALSISGLSLGQDAKNSWHASLKLQVGSMSVNTKANPSGSSVPKTTTL